MGLEEFLDKNRDQLISRCTAKVAQRNAPRATERELRYGIPIFLDQLTKTIRAENVSLGDETASDFLESAESTIAIGLAAASHGNELLRKGFSVEQVVHDYGDLCQSITELAIEGNAPITTQEFRTLNRCLDHAIASAVSEFARERERSNADASEHTTNERLGFLAHEFRDLVHTAMIAVAAIERGNVGISGSTGAVLNRSLKGLQNLCERVLVDVRLKAGLPEHFERILVSELIEESEIAAAIDANARGVELVVADVEPGLGVEVDRHILASALANLLQNAFKFTRPNGRISLKAFSSASRVLIEVEDECGGLPAGKPEDLFRPFEQRSSNRTGLGLGLSISSRGIKASGGELHVRDLPGKGCVFTIDLPQAKP